MKKLFFVILASGIMMTACKKEDVKKETPQGKSWKTADWVMTKSSIIVEGKLCNEYKNQITGQVVYEGLDEAKEVVYDKAAKTDEFGHLTCPNDGDNCKVVKIDGKRALIIKEGVSVN